MKKVSMGVSLAVLLVLGSAAWAKDAAELGRVSVTPMTQATPDMWFYQQYQQQYQNPAEMVRQQADYRAAQRSRRLESMKWFGLSNARPRAGVDMIHGDGSPRWTSNNDTWPDRFQAVNPTTVIVR